jgi:hypothetical protein
MGVLSFDDLTDTESACVRAVYGRRRFEPDPSYTHVLGDEPHAEDWGPDRTVRAAVLCQLLMGEGPVPPESGESPLVLRVVCLGGVRIVGRIDLEAVKVPFPLELTGCWLDDATAPLLYAADLAILRLVGCWLPAGLRADQIRTRSDVIFSRCCFLGEVRLLGAHIGGVLDLAGAKLRNPGKDALNADGMQVDGSVFGGEGFEVDGEVRLLGAHIGGVLDLAGAKLRNPGKYALNADGMQVDGGVFGGEGFEVDGEVWLLGAHIGGQLVLTGAKLRNPGKDALSADRVQIDGGVFGGEGFEVDGEVRLPGAHIGGQLVLTGAKLRNPGKYALSADRVQVAGGVFGGEGFEVDGEVWLPGAHIAGQLVLTGAKLRNPGKDALNADDVQVDGGVFGGEGFEVDGEVRLPGAHIGGQLSLTGAKLRNKDGKALTADRVQVDGDVFGGEGFEVDGEVRLPGAHIAGQLVLTGAKLRNKDGNALNAGRLHVDDSLIWRPATVLGGIDFRFARVGIWADTKAAMYFPAALEGLQYDAIHQEPASPALFARLGWLALDPYGYSPLPYVQLASVLRAGGHDRQARKVLIASQQVRRAQGRNWLTRTGRQSLSAGLRWTVGYGYRPWLALVWLLALIGTASLMIQFLPGGAAKSFTPMTGAPEPFVALLYVLDTVLPFVDFGYSRWVPNGVAQVITVTFIVFGWALATAVVSAFAGILRRGD